MERINGRFHRANQIQRMSNSSGMTIGSSSFLPKLHSTAKPELRSSRTHRLSCRCPPIASSLRPHSFSSPSSSSSCPNLGHFPYRFNFSRKRLLVCGLSFAPQPRESAESEVDAAKERGVEEALEGRESRAVARGRAEKETRTQARVGVGKKASLRSRMAELLDLEKQFSFYGAYHNNRTNIFIHILFVWPIFYTSLILWAYTPAMAPLPLAAGTLPLQEYMVLNASFVQTVVYALYYIALDKKAGSLGAFICFGCWIGANAVAQALPWSLSWKIVLASQVTCWFFQIFGHQKFEGRAPALLDNLPQAFLMAPFFVLLECLQTIGYEPYPGFQKKVQKNVDDAIREFRSSKVKKVA